MNCLETKKLKLNIQNQKNDLNSKVLGIIIDSTDGDKLKINLPGGLILACLAKGTKVASMNISGIDKIGFNSIIEHVKNRVIGELVDIETNDEEKINIVYKYPGIYSK